MSDLPKCKLCGHPAWCVGDTAGHAQCSNDACPLHYGTMTQDQWRALMAPPAVTDVMVERAKDILGTRWAVYAGSGEIRAVLEAAMRE